MLTDRSRWNQKYAHGAEAGLGPSSLLVEYCALAPGPLALDLAAGLGRNSEFLASQGFQVLALDISDTAVRQLKNLGQAGIQPVQLDLDNFRPPGESFDLILNCKFLDRRLCPYLQEALSPGGVLIFESSLESSLPGVEQPSNRDFLLRPQELLHLFLDLHIIYYQEALLLDQQTGQQSSLARLAGLRASTSNPALETES
ncbi:MAG: class I SAM-dependent methyltransferase [Desulfohalobiaceae bacterium]